MEYFNQFLNNEIFFACAIAWAIAQGTKLIINLVKTKKVDLKYVTSSGGFPSSHSSSVTALATSVGLVEGFNSSNFAISSVFALIVMYDAAGVRRAAGEQAEIINDFSEFFEVHGFKVDKKLKELLGHSPFEVFSGAILGIIVAALIVK